MVQLKKKSAAQVPTVLTKKGKQETLTFHGQYDAGAREFSFNADIYAHEKVKETLIDAQDKKCCFCEAKITHVSYGDVEHFRPKGGWVQDDEPLNKPGYYWLAYDWDNLFLACSICNGGNKRNAFPLADNAKRAKSHHDNIVNESPLFVHPVNDNPEDFIGFKEEVPVPVNGSSRGLITIKKLGIDRENLNERRREKLNMIREIYCLAKNYPPTPADLKEQAINTVQKYYEASKKDETEYASMLRCFFKDNPVP